MRISDWSSDVCSSDLALWEAVAKNTTGEVFLQGSIDDPSLPEPLPIALFGSERDGYRVAWRRPQRRDDFGPAIRSSRRDYGDGEQGGGFGDSTAGPDGALLDNGPDTGADADDQLPFRSEERRVGKESVSTFHSRWSRHH